MSAWGNKDTVASPGTITISGTAVSNGAGAATFFSNNYVVGQTIDVGGSGSAVIVAIANNTRMTLASNTELTSTTITDSAHTVSEKPVAVIEGDATTLANTVFGVSVAEQIVSNNLVTTTSNTQAVVANTGAHAGWNKVTAAYVDANGNLRVKTETLVAMGTITGDADDDTLLPDS